MHGFLLRVDERERSRLAPGWGQPGRSGAAQGKADSSFLRLFRCFGGSRRDIHTQGLCSSNKSGLRCQAAFGDNQSSGNQKGGRHRSAISCSPSWTGEGASPAAEDLHALGPGRHPCSPPNRVGTSHCSCEGAAAFQYGQRAQCELPGQ